jgi:hypothetical protein
MPFKPPFDATDPQSWPQNGEPLRITVRPYTPPQASTGNPTAADGIDDWSVPGSGQSDTSYPDDWFVPSVSSNTNSIQTPPNFQSAPVATANGNTSAPPSNNSPAPRPDPLAAYWSLIPASRAGAMAWHPPIFLSPNPFAPGNIPASAWVTAPPITARLPDASTSPKVPAFDAGQGLLGAIARLPDASASPNAPTFDALPSLLGAIARLPGASTSPNAPTFDASPSLLGAIARLPGRSTPLNVAVGTGQGLLAPISWAQPVPNFGSSLFSVPPFDAASSLGDPDPRRSLPGSQAAPAPPSQFAGVDGFPIFNAYGTIPPSPGATPLATTAGASFARGRTSPGGSVLAGPDSNPLSRLLNALNPISPANAAEDEGGGLPPALAQALLQGLLDAATAKRLAEQRKILQEAEDARRELFEVAQGRASSRALGVMLEAKGVPRPAGYAAHHIAAGADPRADIARGVLQKFGIGINDALNGVFLPANRATQVIAGETIHSTLHTDAYYEAVDKALQKATTREEATGILRDIGRALQSGDYP